MSDLDVEVLAGVDLWTAAANDARQLVEARENRDQQRLDAIAADQARLAVGHEVFVSDVMTARGLNPSDPIGRERFIAAEAQLGDAASSIDQLVAQPTGVPSFRAYGGRMALGGV